MADGIALFDFDGTLTRSDSFITFARHAVRPAKLLGGVLATLPHILLWKLGIISGGRAKEALFGRLYGGMSHSEWCAKCRDFVPIIASGLRSDMLETLHRHQAAGHRTIIVTASPADWVKPWAESEGIEMVIGTEIAVDGSAHLTGRFATPNCHGSEKVTRLLAAIPDIRSHETWAYGDSPSDAPLLAASTHPHMV